MTLNAVIYTTSKAKQIRADLAFVRECLLDTKGREDVSFTIKEVKSPKQLPVLKDSDRHIRPAWAALEGLYPAGEYNAVGFHFTPKERRKWGIEQTINGSYDRSRSHAMYFWVCAEPGKKARQYPFTDFARIVLHEIQHGDVHLTGAPRDLVHEWDYLKASIHKLPKDLSYDTWNRLLKTVKELEANLKAKTKTMTLPIPKKYLETVTQAFFTANKHYKSGVHNGTDFGCPVGTPLVAPCDGEIIHRFVNHASLGTAINFVCEDEKHYIRFLHLSKALPPGKYKQGEVIGWTGNTGDSSGPHLHVDVWKCPINTALIKTAQGVEKYLVDPVAFFTA